MAEDWWPLKLKHLKDKYDASKLKIFQNSLECKLSIIQLQNAVVEEKFITTKYEKETVEERLVVAVKELEEKHEKEKEVLSKNAQDVLKRSEEEWKEKVNELSKKLKSLEDQKQNEVTSRDAVIGEISKRLDILKKKDDDWKIEQSKLLLKIDALEKECEDLSNILNTSKKDKEVQVVTLDIEHTDDTGFLGKASMDSTSKPQKNSPNEEIINNNVVPKQGGNNNNGNKAECADAGKDTDTYQQVEKYSDVEISFLKETEKILRSCRRRSSLKENEGDSACDRVFLENIGVEATDTHRSGMKTRRSKRRVTFSNELEVRQFDESKERKDIEAREKAKQEEFEPYEGDENGHQGNGSHDNFAAEDCQRWKNAAKPGTRSRRKRGRKENVPKTDSGQALVSESMKQEQKEGKTNGRPKRGVKNSTSENRVIMSDELTEHQHDQSKTDSKNTDDNEVAQIDKGIGRKVNQSAVAVELSNVERAGAVETGKRGQKARPTRGMGQQVCKNGDIQSSRLLDVFESDSCGQLLSRTTQSNKATRTPSRQAKEKPILSTVTSSANQEELNIQEVENSKVQADIKRKKTKVGKVDAEIEFRITEEMEDAHEGLEMMEITGDIESQCTRNEMKLEDFMANEKERGSRETERTGRSGKRGRPCTNVRERPMRRQARSKNAKIQAKEQDNNTDDLKQRRKRTRKEKTPDDVENERKRKEPEAKNELDNGDRQKKQVNGLNASELNRVEITEKNERGKRKVKPAVDERLLKNEVLLKGKDDKKATREVKLAASVDKMEEDDGTQGMEKGGSAAPTMDQKRECTAKVPVLTADPLKQNEVDGCKRTTRSRTAKLAVSVMNDGNEDVEGKKRNVAQQHHETDSSEKSDVDPNSSLIEETATIKMMASTIKDKMKGVEEHEARDGSAEGKNGGKTVEDQNRRSRRKSAVSQHQPNVNEETDNKKHVKRPRLLPGLVKQVNQQEAQEPLGSQEELSTAQSMGGQSEKNGDAGLDYKCQDSNVSEDVVGVLKRNSTRRRVSKGNGRTSVEAEPTKENVTKSTAKEGKKNKSSKSKNKKTNSKSETIGSCEGEVADKSEVEKRKQENGEVLEKPSQSKVNAKLPEVENEGKIKNRPGDEDVTRRQSSVIGGMSAISNQARTDEKENTGKTLSPLKRNPNGSSNSDSGQKTGSNTLVCQTSTSNVSKPPKKKRRTLCSNSTLINTTSMFQETIPLNSTRTSGGMPPSLQAFMKAFIVPKLKK